MEHDYNDITDLFCSVLFQGEKLRISQNIAADMPLTDAESHFAHRHGIGTIGQHTEAIRQLAPPLIRKTLPEANQEELVEMMAELGITLDLRPRRQRRGEGPKP